MNAKADTGPHGATPVTTHAGTRRLSPLETATAVAIILSCLTATAMMTGVMPKASQPVSTTVPVVARVGGDALPAPAAVVAMPARDANSPVGTNTARAASPLQAGGSSADQANVTAAGAAGEIERPPAATPGAPPAVSTLATSPATAIHPVANTLATASPARPRRVRASHGGHAGGTSSRVKTREEVVAELLKAKRDGSYSSAMEAYR